jgi:hypothetical protein
MAAAIQPIRGMNDILPEQTPPGVGSRTAWRVCSMAYGYREIRVPIVERTELFKRSIGEVTDIVEKEMYTFEDRNGDSAEPAARGTASCVRAAIEHGLATTSSRGSGTPARCSATRSRRRAATASSTSSVSRRSIRRPRYRRRVDRDDLRACGALLGLDAVTWS